MPVISRIGPDFTRWDELLVLIQAAFAYMDGMIDPPSSATRLSADILAIKAQDEIGFFAENRAKLVGCIFAADHPHHMYIGKLAVAPVWQGRGLGKQLMTEIADHAVAAHKSALELQVRIELTGNQQAFEKMGFRDVARTAHPGFDRPTSITMRKTLI